MSIYQPLELFYQEDRRYGLALKKAGVPYHLEVVRGALRGVYGSAPKPPIVRSD